MQSGCISKTITTYLVDGNPNGIRTCFISNKICKAVVVPRAKRIEAKRRLELQTLDKDFRFKSPSAAGLFCLGNSANGWYLG